MLKNFRNFMNQKGQTFILYALLVPLLFITGGAGVDLGWYYINVARLQNAADSAVIAGARELVKNLHNGNDTIQAAHLNMFIIALSMKFRAVL